MKGTVMSTEIVQSSGGESLHSKMEYAKALAQAGLLPQAYKQQPANVLAAIEYGEALGIKPIVAINEINVISGTPSPSASLMASLARAAGHRVRAWNEDDGTAVCEIVRADDPDFTHRSRWDETKARQAKLWGRGHWEKDPATMLRWRAISECVRLACPEVLGGLKYTPEEVLEMQQDRPAPTPVVSEQVPRVPPIPADLADKIAASDDVGWLTRTADYLAKRWGEHEPEKVADLQALCAARVDSLASNEPEPSLEDAQATLEDVLDAETVEDAAS